MRIKRKTASSLALVGVGWGGEGGDIEREGGGRERE